jgi:hypothetical protein
LFFVDPRGALRSAPAKSSSDGRPIVGQAILLNVPLIGSGHYGTEYDVSPDGRRIYFLDRRIEPSATEFGVVLGWRALLR